MKEYRSNYVLENLSEKVHYTFDDYPIYIRKDFLSDYPDYSGVSHWHADLEFVYVVAGEMTYSVDGRKVVLRQDTGIVVNSSHLHFGYSKEHTECEFVCLIVSPMLFSINDCFEERYVRPVLQDGRMAYLYLSKEHEWQKEILACLKKIYALSTDGERFLDIQQRLYQIWNQIFYHMVPRPVPVRKKNSDLIAVKAMVSYIHQNYTDKIALEQIAAAGSVCKSKCCTLFKTYLSRTPGEFVNEYRIRKSLDDLIGSDLTITQISSQVGINSASYYSELFRKYFACSPKEYIRQHAARQMKGEGQ